MSSSVKTQQTGLRLPSNVLKAFRMACLKKDTTTQAVLEKAVYDFIDAADIPIESDKEA